MLVGLPRRLRWWASSSRRTGSSVQNIGSLVLSIISIWVNWCLAWNGVSGVKIERLSIPSSVENGTADSVILDCIYSYSQDDQQLVVKWFFNKDPKPIYQWIPDLSKRSYTSSPRFEGHINRHYVATQDWYTRYRALNILRPTTDMSGTYSCSVTSLQSQDTRAADMIVYAKPKKFDLSFLQPEDSEETQFRCQVEGIFPQPQVLMYRVEQMNIAGGEYMNVDNMTGQLNYSVQPIAERRLADGTSEVRESALSVQAQQRRAARDGYSTILTTSLSNRHFRRGHSTARHLFFCVYSIPSTDIKQTRVLEFYPEDYCNIIIVNLKLYQPRGTTGTPGGLLTIQFRSDLHHRTISALKPATMEGSGQKINEKYSAAYSMNYGI